MESGGRINQIFSAELIQRHRLVTDCYYMDSTDFNEWSLEPYNEYRFELDPESSLAIKVSPFSPDFFRLNSLFVSR